MRFAVLILAAGASTRMGRPKQLLPFLGTTFIEHAVDQAVAAGAAQTIVVTGANAEPLRTLLENYGIRLVHNESWSEGMGKSIACGTAAIDDDIDCLVITLCDLPRVTGEHLRALAERLFATGDPIVASSYDGVKGVPCAFSSVLFGQLQKLEGEAGARELIRQSGVRVGVLELHAATLDVDTPEEYGQLLSE